MSTRWTRFVDTIGMFLNLLPAHFHYGPPGTLLADTAKEMSQKVLAALAHSKLLFNVPLDVLNVPRSPAHTPLPLFQTFVSYRTGWPLRR